MQKDSVHAARAEATVYQKSACLLFPSVPAWSFHVCGKSDRLPVLFEVILKKDCKCFCLIC